MLTDTDIAILETLEDALWLRYPDKRKMTQAAIRASVHGNQERVNVALHDLCRRGLVARKMRGIKPMGWVITEAGLKSTVSPVA
jgi:hypothetical protein